MADGAVRHASQQDLQLAIQVRHAAQSLVDGLQMMSRDVAGYEDAVERLRGLAVAALASAVALHDSVEEDARTHVHCWRCCETAPAFIGAYCAPCAATMADTDAAHADDWRKARREESRGGNVSRNNTLVPWGLQ